MLSNTIPTPEQALPGRSSPLQVTNKHFIHAHVLQPPFSNHLEQIVFGLGCFWGAEKKFWPIKGVYTTAVGYSAGYTPNPTYAEVCSGNTGHNEVVLVIYDPQKVTLDKLLQVFWESHDPTQGMRQGNDRGTQYRSGIYTTSDAQQQVAEVSRGFFQQTLRNAGYGTITTEIKSVATFYYAEDYHQQYLAKKPGGYCGPGGTGITASNSY